MEKRKMIGLYVEPKLNESINHISKNVEYMTKTAYIRKLIVEDIKRRIDKGDETLSKIFYNK